MSENGYGRAIQRSLAALDASLRSQVAFAATAQLTESNAPRLADMVRTEICGTGVLPAERSLSRRDVS
jgi:hypothetical protein